MLIQPKIYTRQAFTLAEMLVALGIILLLVSMTAFAILRFRNTGPYNATVANMNKIKAALDTQWKAVVDKARKDTLPGEMVPYANWKLGLTNSPSEIKSLTDPRIRDLYLSLKLVQAFPINFSEAISPSNPFGLPGCPTHPVLAWPNFKKFLSGVGVNSLQIASGVPADIQQSICLMMILEKGPMNGNITSEALGLSAATRLDFPSTNQQTFGCVDAWGNPLFFSRNFKAKANNLGLLSTGPNKKIGLLTFQSNPVDANHTLSMPDPRIDSDGKTPMSFYAEDNVTIPE